MLRERGGSRSFNAYVDALNETLNRTITTSRLTLRVSGRSNARTVSRFIGQNALPLELRPSGNFLFVFQTIRQETHRILTESATYIFSTSDDLRDEEAWLFRSDYVRFTDNNHPHAHIHVNARHRFADQPVHHIHFPSARISLEQLIAYLIVEHGIQLLHGVRHEDAMALLQRNHAEFMKRRTDQEVFP